MSQFKRVEDGIFIGPQPTEQDIQEARQQGIRTVIDFRLPSETATCCACSMTYRPTINRSSLDPADALGAALAAAFATESKPINDAIRGSWQRSDTDANAALTASALMGMNTVWYPYVEMAEGA